MPDQLDSKRLSDDELEAVSGGVAPPTIDPSALAGLMHSQVSTALSGGGAYTADTHAAAHTDVGTPAVTGQTHTTVSGSDLFGHAPSIAPTVAPTGVPLSSLGPVAHGTIGISGSLDVSPPTPVAPAIQISHPLDNKPHFTTITPTVVGQSDPAPVGSVPTGPNGSLSGTFSIKPQTGPHSSLSDTFNIKH